MARVWRGVVDRLKHSARALQLADRVGRAAGRWRPLDALTDPPLPRRPDLSAFESSPLACCWVGHATMLLRIDGRTVLTDPVFSNRVGLTLGPMTVGPRRLVAPAIPLSRLPRVDVLAISHAHFDHLDLASLRALRRRFPDVEVVAAAWTGDLLRDIPFRSVTELRVGETASVAGVAWRAIAVNHWTPRVFCDTWRTACAYELRRGGQRVLFCGDTAMTHSFDGLDPDLMCVGIGAYDPYVASHATPEQAWSMATSAGARRVAAMHHSTFRLSVEPDNEPLRRFLEAAGEGRGRIAVRNVGDVWRAV